MSSFKLFWTAHQWTGIVLALVFLCTAGSGFLLLIKKRVAWLQPPTQKGAPGDLAQFITVQRLFDAVFAHGHDGFRTLEDIDRIDFQPGKRVFKVVSVHGYAELQVDAITAEILSESWRPSDLLEDIHDGSFWASWMHEWVMPVVSLALIFMVFSGLWLWIEPMLRRRRRRRLMSS